MWPRVGRLGRRRMPEYGASYNWFQVCCSHCDEALSVQLGVGESAVRCDACKEVFTVRVHESHMQIRPSKMADTRGEKIRRRAAAAASGEKAPVPPALAAYRLHMRLEMKRLYTQNTGASKEEVFKAAAALWKDSPMHPKNKPAVDDAGGAAEGDVDEQ